MSKAILMSVHAKWCALMMNGKKKIEVRKGTTLYKAIQKLIDEYGYADIYVYCTLGSPYLAKPKESEKYLLFTKGAIKLIKETPINGKVIFKFCCYKVEEIFVGEQNNDYFYKTTHLTNKELQNKSCLSNKELLDYLNLEQGTAIHINVLEIFDKPKELSEFFGTKQYFVGCESGIDKTPRYARLTNAPQSFQYIETGE